VAASSESSNASACTDGTTMRFFDGAKKLDFDVEKWERKGTGGRRKVPPIMQAGEPLAAEPWGMPLAGAEPAEWEENAPRIQTPARRWPILIFLLLVAFGAGWGGATWVAHLSNKDATPSLPVYPLSGEARHDVGRKAYLGIRGKDFQQGDIRGVKILEVFPDSPAAKAGLRSGRRLAPEHARMSGDIQGHIVVGANGRAIESEDELSQLLASSPPGSVVKFLVRTSDRDSYAVIPVTLGVSPSKSPELDASAESKGLDASPMVGTPESRMEDELFRTINQARERRGLAPLKESAQLQQVARRHSEDMATRQFFAHINSDGADVVGRLRAEGVKDFTAIGENIFSGRNTPNLINLTVREWLRSPGQRKNVLHPRYSEGGVGIARGEGDTIYITQVYLEG
jgi:uncharacterized protein YkwD